MVSFSEDINLNRTLLKNYSVTDKTFSTTKCFLYFWVVAMEWLWDITTGLLLIWRKSMLHPAWESSTLMRTLI